MRGNPHVRFKGLGGPQGLPGYLTSVVKPSTIYIQPRRLTSATWEGWLGRMEIDEHKVDDVVLALLRLTLHDKVVFGLRGRGAWMRQIKHVARRQWSGTGSARGRVEQLHPLPAATDSSLIAL
jgi:hypothetical protein